MAESYHKFFNNKTLEYQDAWFKYSEKERFLSENPDLEEVYKFSFVDENFQEHSNVYLTDSQLEEYLKNNPTHSRIFSTAPLVSGRGMKKPDDGFRDILRNIKKKNNTGITRSTINTF